MDYPKSVANVGLVDGKFVDENTATGVVGSLIPSDWGNAVTDELLGVIKAAGLTPSESDLTQLTKAIRTLSVGVVGSMRNSRMAIPAASATATFSADEIVVGSALGGQAFKLSNFSKTINLAASGAGGMDTGTAPASGFVALYAIYNPTTGVSALLAVNATSVKVPEVYGGANMPAGYTASALISVWGVASSQFKVGAQFDRRVDIVSASVLNSTTPVTSQTTLSIAAAAPLNAKSARMAWGCLQGTAASGVSLTVASAASGVGIVGVSSVNTQGTGQGSISADVQLVTPQTVYYSNASTAAVTNSISVTGYQF